MFFFLTILIICPIQIIYFLVYMKYGESAIIFIIGDIRIEEEFPSINAAQIESLEKQYYNYWNNLAEILSDDWGWDYYCYLTRNINLMKFHYSKLLLLFVGHGKYENQQYFALTKNKWIVVSNIPRNIECNNLTVVVDSCQSVNWVAEFEHENLNRIYTGDLNNETSYQKIIFYYNSSTSEIQLQYINAFSSYFISALLGGQSFEQANFTAYNTMN